MTLKTFDMTQEEKENSEFKPKFTYNEKDYSELANKLIEFRNNTPLCSVSYRDGEGRKIILHYEKEILKLVKNEILKDIPKWKKDNNNLSSLTYRLDNRGDGNILLCKKGYAINIIELLNLPKEE